MANISISLEGIDQAIENLNYRTGSVKYRAVTAIRSFYTTEESIKELDGIDPDLLIPHIWDVGDNHVKIKAKRRNFSSIKSSINVDLQKLSKRGLNEENIIITDFNLFDMSEEAKNNLLNSFTDAVKTGDIDLDQATVLLKTVTDFLENLKLDETDEDPKNIIDQIKKILSKITEDVLSEEDLEETPGLRRLKTAEDFSEDIPDFEEVEEDDLLDDDVEEIELDEDEDIEVVDEDEIDEDLDDIEEIELDEDDEFEEVDEDDLLDDDVEEIELDEDEDIEVVDEDEIDEDLDDIEEIELDEDDELEEVEEDDLLDDDVEEIELDEDEDIELVDEDVIDEDLADIEEIELDEDDELEEVEEDDLLDDDVEEIELDEDEEIEEIDALGEEEDEVALEDVELDEDDLFDELEEVDEDTVFDEDVEEIDLDEDEELEDIEELDEEELKALEEFREQRKLAEEFDKTLGEREKKYNQYTTVPSGLYTIGTRKDLKSSLDLQQFEMPKVYIGVYPVTNSFFEIFIETTGYVTTAEKKGYGCVYSSRFRQKKNGAVWSKNSGSKDVAGACWYQPEGPGSNLHGKRNHPVVQISVEDAVAFASWIGRRIPTEAEWEAAARTDLGNKYPWGNTFDAAALNIEQSGNCDTCDVDRYDAFANEFGIVDMLGNVMEWTCDTQLPPVRARSEIKYSVAKGAAWNAKPDVTISSRALFKPGFTSNIIGFRCISEMFQ